MGNTSVKGYVDIWGKHGALPVDHTGPASYVTGGETIKAAQLGLRSIDFLTHMSWDTTGLYSVKAHFTGTGLRTSVLLQWYNSSGTEISAGTNLSAIIIRLFAIGG